MYMYHVNKVFSLVVLSHTHVGFLAIGSYTCSRLLAFISLILMMCGWYTESLSHLMLVVYKGA